MGPTGPSSPAVQAGPVGLAQRCMTEALVVLAGPGPATALVVVAVVLEVRTAQASQVAPQTVSVEEAGAEVQVVDCPRLVRLTRTEAEGSR